MSEKRTSVFSNGLIWFGAGVSMSEILTGTYFAPLGMKTGLLAILIGHVIGCILLFSAGYLGAKTNNNAMETVAVSFGRKGNLPFSILNIFLNKVQILDNLYNQIFQYIKQNLLFDLFSLKHHHN